MLAQRVFTHSEDAVLSDLRELRTLSDRQTQRIVQLRARLATAIDMLRENRLFEEYEKRVEGEKIQ